MPPRYLFPDGARFGSDNIVLHARAKRHTVNSFPGPLSIKTVVRREFIHSHADGALSLDAVAKTACLSPYHFHRVFTQVFEKTPHAYVTQVRLARAHSMIQSGMAVTGACVGVGFSSTTTFSRLFRAQYGTLPSKIRAGRK